MNASKRILIAALALGGALGAATAHANGANVQWSVTIGGPIGVPVFAPPPVYVPAPVYVPEPVYVPAPVYLPVPVYVPAPARVRYVPVVQAPVYGPVTRWDHDGDGIPNRYDRVYNPAWDRDGDGVPDRYEQRRHHHHYDASPVVYERRDGRSGWGRDR